MSEPFDWEKERAVRRWLNTSEQYQAIGKFVEAFEDMVEAARGGSANLFDRAHHKLAVTILHHQALTAKPILEIFRALMAEYLDTGPNNNHLITDETRDICNGVLGTIAKEYIELANKRNSLLHGTWAIGWSSDEYDSTFTVYKFAVSKSGLSQQMDLPTTADDLLALSKRCENTSRWISAMRCCFQYGPAGPALKKQFRHNGSTWVLISARGRREETLP